MERFLLVQVPPDTTRLLREALRAFRIEEATAEEAIARGLERRTDDLGALVIGPRVASPVRLVEQACVADPALAVLILCERGRYPHVIQELRFAAFASQDVECVTLSPEEDLVGLLRDAARRTRQRRRHQALLAAAKTQAAEGIKLPRVFLDALQESEDRFRAIFEQAAVGVAEIETRTGRFVRINQRYCDLVGIRAEDMKATTFMEITHPDDLQADQDNMERLKAGEVREFSMEKRYIRPDREIVWVNLTVSPMWRAGEEPSCHIAVVEDITDRKRAEEALRSSEERFRLAVETARDPIVTIDAESRILSVNRATETVFGYAASELIGQSLTILMPHSRRAAYTGAFREYIMSGKRRIRWEGAAQWGRHRSGREIPLEVSIGEFLSDGRRVFTGILRDISERKREERRLIAEKQTLEQLAEFTAEVEAALTLEEVLTKLFETFQSVIPYDRMGCALLDDEGRTARSVWMRSTSTDVQIDANYSARLEGSSLEGVLESGRPRILNDLQAYLREHPDSENTRRILAEGVRSNLACPLVAMGKPVGFLFFSSNRPHAYDEAHVEIYLRVAEHISCTLEKARLYGQLMEAKREVEVRNRLIAEVFGRYTSEAIVSRLLESPEGLKMGGETRKVTLLLADLAGFTPLCAELDPQRVVRLLNIYLDVMADVIIGHGGTIDEFLGDAILAVFGAPVCAADDARRALACALAMQRAMEVVKNRLREEGLPPMEMGIAVHTGEVVVGNIGSSRRAKYGIVGSAINLASRIEAQSEGGQILCSDDTLREVGDIVEFDERRELRVKGLSETVPVVSVRGLRDQPELSLPTRSP